MFDSGDFALPKRPPVASDGLRVRRPGYGRRSLLNASPETKTLRPKNFRREAGTFNLVMPNWLNTVCRFGMVVLGLPITLPLAGFMWFNGFLDSIIPPVQVDYRAKRVYSRSMTTVPPAPVNIRVDLLQQGDLFRLIGAEEIWAVCHTDWDAGPSLVAVNQVFTVRKFAPYLSVVPLRRQERKPLLLPVVASPGPVGESGVESEAT